MQQKNLSKLANFSTFGLSCMGPPQNSHFSFTLRPSMCRWKCFFCLFRCSNVSPSPFLLLLSTLDKSISGLTDFMRPMFTRRSYLDLTVGVLTFVSRDIALNDFLPFSISDFSIATSVLSSWTGNLVTVLNRQIYLITLQVQFT